MYEAALYLAVFAALYVLWRYTQATRHSPGPFRWPIVGNAFQIPTETPWRQFMEWGKQYGSCCLFARRVTQSIVGDVVYLLVFGRSILVLNSLEAIRDLYEQKSGIYSDKSQRVMAEL